MSCTQEVTTLAATPSCCPPSFGMSKNMFCGLQFVSTAVKIVNDLSFIEFTKFEKTPVEPKSAIGFGWKKPWVDGDLREL